MMIVDDAITDVHVSPDIFMSTPVPSKLPHFDSNK
jgi:hypothetical protein